MGCRRTERQAIVSAAEAKNEATTAVVSLLAKAIDAHQALPRAGQLFRIIMLYQQ